MSAFRLRGSDEGRHLPGTEGVWGESWYHDFASTDGTYGGWLRLGLYPNLGTCWYHALVCGPDRQTVAVVDQEVPLPKEGSLEIRSQGLWADHIGTHPLERWQLSNEAFAVGVDDPAELYRPGGARGDQVAMGLDLEWEAYTPVYDYPYPDGHLGAHYEHAGIVHGELLIGPDRVPFEGRGERDHSWGWRDWWIFGWHWTSFQIGDAPAVNFVRPEGGVIVLTNVRTLLRSDWVDASSAVQGVVLALVAVVWAAAVVWSVRAHRRAVAAAAAADPTPADTPHPAPATR